MTVNEVRLFGLGLLLYFAVCGSILIAINRCFGLTRKGKNLLKTIGMLTFGIILLLARIVEILLPIGKVVAKKLGSAAIVVFAMMIEAYRTFEGYIESFEIQE